MSSAIARSALFLGGLLLVAWLVRAAGAEQVLQTVRGAGPWLPLIVLLELGILATDFVASRALIVDDGVTSHRWIWARAAAMAYAWSILLPAGRAAGEAIRAATLAPIVGAARATRGCARLQASALLGISVISLVCAFGVARNRLSTVLWIALAMNGALCASLGSVILLVARNRRFGDWLSKRFTRFAHGHEEDGTDSVRPPVARAVAICVGGRAIQALQYGVVLIAVGAPFSATMAIVAQGIHLVGASIGDLIPNQMGATEGAYGAFENALALDGAPARALSIALVVRLAQLGLSAICLLVSLKKPDHMVAL